MSFDLEKRMFESKLNGVAYRYTQLIREVSKADISDKEKAILTMSLTVASAKETEQIIVDRQKTKFASGGVVNIDANLSDDIVEDITQKIREAIK